MPRVTIIVLDGAGVGALPDAEEYGDAGAATLPNLARAVGGLTLPSLERLGLGNIVYIEGVERVKHPLASWGRMAELSSGKDTITGHWEMMGVVSETPFPTYPNGFPEEIISAFVAKTGKRPLGNKAASGTDILEELGPEHMSTGRPIVYTSADSVFQIAAHEEVIPPGELYAICEAAREILTPPHAVARVIARPFVGPPFKRTYGRKDFALPPTGETLLDVLTDEGIEVWSVGKVCDMFGGVGFSNCISSAGNADGMQKLVEAREAIGDEGLLFLNLVDFDTLYGHRNDPRGYAGALEEFDGWLGGYLDLLDDEDWLFITADHGCDPTYPTTDHTREYVPVLMYAESTQARALGRRESFNDLGASIAGIFGIDKSRFTPGKSFLPGS